MVLEPNAISEVRLPDWAGVGEGDVRDGQVKPITGGMVVVVDVDGVLRVFQVQAIFHRLRVWVTNRAVGNLGSLPHITIINGHGERRNGG